jgi:NADPH:quinone reductase-like Zn-dependent oxidoreductase
VLVLEDIPTPQPASGEALVKVKAAAINHFDLHLREGFRFNLALPHILGLEVAGDVVAVGPGVSQAWLGKAVIPRHLLPTRQLVGVHIPGGYAEYLAVPAAVLMEKPAALSYEQAAPLQLAFSAAWHALTTRAQLKPGETVLINAAGSGVGTAAIQLAKHIGARVIASSGDDQKLDTAKKLGADEAVNYRSKQVVERVRELTNGAGVNVVFDSVGGKHLQDSLQTLGRGGRAVNLGSMGGEEVSINVPDLFLNERCLMGSVGATPDEIEHMIELAGRGVIAAVIDRTLPLEDAAEGHRILEAHRAFGKILLIP